MTSYETAVRDLSLLKMIRWNALVLDEAQNIRNPDAKRTKAVKQIHRNVSFAVTGTPVENRLRDLWSIMDFAMPGYLDDLATFEHRYAENDDEAAMLEPLISPLILRRRVKEVARDLPPRIDIPEILELDEDEALAYEAARAAVFREYGAAATLVSLGKLRQFCCHPGILDEVSRHRQFSKFRRLLELLAEIFDRREKALVFTSFTAMADRIAMTAQQDFMVLAATVDGRLPIPERQPLIDRFSGVRRTSCTCAQPPRGRHRTEHCCRQSCDPVQPRMEPGSRRPGCGTRLSTRANAPCNGTTPNRCWYCRGGNGRAAATQARGCWKRDHRRQGRSKRLP